MRSIRLAMYSCLIVCISQALLGCSKDALPPLVATNIEITEPMPGRKMSAAYLSLTNNTDAAISISSVTSPEFESVEVHESLIEDGVAKMRRISELSVPAQSTVSLRRGGKHIMLMRPTGSTQQVTLNFLSGDTILLGVNAPTTPRNR